MPPGATLPQPLEHGFLTLHNLGCFHPVGAWPGDPEILLHRGQLIVDQYYGLPLFVAELAQVPSPAALPMMSRCCQRADAGAGRHHRSQAATALAPGCTGWTYPENATQIMPAAAAHDLLL